MTASNLCMYLQQTNLPVFKIKESSVRRRYSDFEWLRSELERDSKVSDVSISPFLSAALTRVLLRMLCGCNR